MAICKVLEDRHRHPQNLHHPYPRSSHTQLQQQKPNRLNKMNEWEWTRREQYKFFNSWAANLLTAYNPEEAASDGESQDAKRREEREQGSSSPVEQESAGTDEKSNNANGTDSSSFSAHESSSSLHGSESSPQGDCDQRMTPVQSESSLGTTHSSEPTSPSSSSSFSSAPPSSPLGDLFSQLSSLPSPRDFQLSFPLTNTQSRLVSSSNRSARLPQQQVTSQEQWNSSSSSSKRLISTLCGHFQSGSEPKRRRTSFITVLTRRESNGGGSVIIDATIGKGNTGGFARRLCRMRTSCARRRSSTSAASDEHLQIDYRWPAMGVKQCTPVPAPPRRLLLREQDRSRARRRLRKSREHSSQAFQSKRSPLSQIAHNAAQRTEENVESDSDSGPDFQTWSEISATWHSVGFGLGP